MAETSARWVVQGVVQGVGYRYFTQRAATELGVRGIVRNLADGTVEVQALASPEALEAFRARLLEGPRWSDVSGIRDTGAASEPIPGSFEVRY